MGYVHELLQSRACGIPCLYKIRVGICHLHVNPALHSIYVSILYGNFLSFHIVLISLFCPHAIPLYCGIHEALCSVDILYQRESRPGTMFAGLFHRRV